jgi:hypothetical protein
MAKIAWPAVLALAFIGSLALRLAFPVYAIGSGAYDDMLFVRLAEQLRAGQWLGAYDNLTLAKGAAYSGFVALNHLLGLPLKISEHVVYLLAALYFSCVVGSQFASRAMGAVLFTLLAFNPVFWAPEIGGRVVRENLYISLTLFVVALGVRVFVAPHAGPIGQELREKRWHLAALGVTGAVFWLTREEGAWIAPAVVVLLGYWLFGVLRARRRPLGALVAFLAVPVVAFAAIVGSVDAINLAKYGVFRNNDFRSGDFQSAYGALARIRHDRWMPYVVFPKDARARAYSVSAAAQELKPYFDGEGDKFWRRVSCEQTQRTECPEILSGWFMWALREAVTSAGHYANAVDTQAFYRRLAQEVNEGCDRGAIGCGPRHDSLIPPWHPSFPGATLDAVRRVFPTMAALGDPKVYIAPSLGNEEQLRLFRTMTGEALATPQDAASTDVRISIARRIAALEIGFASIAFPVAIAAWIVLLVHAVVRKRWHTGHVIVAALMAGVATRLLLLAFLEATSIPANNALYPSPAVPLELAFVPCVFFLVVNVFRSRRIGGSNG